MKIPSTTWPERNWRSKKRQTRLPISSNLTLRLSSRIRNKQCSSAHLRSRTFRENLPKGWLGTPVRSNRVIGYQALLTMISSCCWRKALNCRPLTNLLKSPTLTLCKTYQKSLNLLSKSEQWSPKGAQFQFKWGKIRANVSILHLNWVESHQ